MDININYQDEVWTQDGLKLGVADRIYHRAEGVDPDVKYYDSYLHVEDFDIGLAYFIPTDYIGEKDEGQQRIILTQTRKQVLNNTWNRKPDFVAGGHAEIVSLEPVAAS